MSSCTYMNNGAATMRSGASPERREHLYWTTCLPVRCMLAALVLAATVAFAGRPVFGRGLCGLLILAVLAMIVNATIAANPGCRWWDSKRSVVAASAVALIAAAGCGGMVSHTAAGLAVSAVLVSHVAYGASEATSLQPWG
jgi:hypothetical protein